VTQRSFQRVKLEMSALLAFSRPTHAETGLIKSIIANVRAALRRVGRAAEQLPVLDRWRALLAYICDKIVGHNPLPAPPPALAAPAYLQFLG